MEKQNNVTVLFVEWIVNHLQNCADTPTIVFVNKCGTATYLNKELSSNDINNSVLHGSVSTAVS